MAYFRNHIPPPPRFVAGYGQGKQYPYGLLSFGLKPNIAIVLMLALKLAMESKTMTSKQTVTLAEIARELNINPKVARAKARRNAGELPKTLNEDGWAFDAKLKRRL